MNHSRPLILISEGLSQPALDWLRERAAVIETSGTNDAEFINTISQADGLVVRTYTRVDEGMLDRAARLRVVGRAGTGLDNIDVRACRSRGIEVVYAPEANTQAVVEYVIALMFDALRPRPSLSEAIEAEHWHRLRTQAVGTRELANLTLGILGLGRVGKRLAQVTRPLVKSIIYDDLIEIPVEDRQGASPVPVEELFAKADVISVHIDGRNANRQFVDKRLISHMKSEVVFINTSRGFVVENRALGSFLRAHPLSLAMLDVHDPEPFSGDHPLLGLPNARLYPHLASRTVRAMENMSWVVREVMAVLEGRVPQYPVPPDQ